MKIYVTEPSDGSKFKMAGKELISEVKKKKGF
jgi:hypothetical protein